jgi:hypothetical protein
MSTTRAEHEPHRYEPTDDERRQHQALGRAHARAQGLPLKVEDPVHIAEVAALMDQGRKVIVSRSPVAG